MVKVKLFYVLDVDEVNLSLNLLGLFIMLSVIGILNCSKQDLEQFRKQFQRKHAKRVLNFGTKKN